MSESPSNLERMLQLVDEVFATRKDPDQLQVDDAVLRKLTDIHPATLSEYDDGNGPVVWILLIPTTLQVMDEFIAGRISENELLARTEPGQTYEAIYLCSATVLPEYRKKGIAFELCAKSIAAIAKDHPVSSLYVWPFTAEGERLAQKVSLATGLRLYVVHRK